MTAPRRLSGLSTPFLKFVFAPIWILGFGAGVTISWLDPQGLVAANPGEASARWWMTALFLAGTTFLYWSGVSAKRVHISETGLIVSNFLVAETVPFSDIAEVSQFTWAHPRMVTVRFTRPTRFGDSIRFLPRFALWSIPLADDAVVSELSALSRRGPP
jgi:acyl dehydratase